MKVALFKRINTQYSYETVKDDSWEKLIGDDYVRVSEYVEVEFPPLPSDEIVQKQLDALDKTESALRNQFQAALNGIDQQRAELRAITYTP